MAESGGTELTERMLDAEDPEYDDADATPEDQFADSPLKSKINIILSSLKFQLLMMLVVVGDIVVLVLILEDHLSKEDFAHPPLGLVGMAIGFSSLFMAEVGIRVWMEGPNRFFCEGKDSVFKTIEFCIVVLSLVVELVEFGETVGHLNFPYWLEELLIELAVFPVVILRVVKLVIMLRQRTELAKKYTRQFVSADRRRYKKDGFDLDLTYISDNVIAMSWPSVSMEALYRNNIQDVAAFLDKTHAEKYRVYPLCSERKYDESFFHYQVRRFKLDDHNPCDIGMMIDFVKDAETWLNADPGHIIVVHCKGGKGRTGTMICSWLLKSKACPDANASLGHFGNLRSSDTASKVQGVESPSQDRYVKHFAFLNEKYSSLDAMYNALYNDRKVSVNRITLNPMPMKCTDPSLLWFVILAGSTNELLYCSNPAGFTPKESNRYIPVGGRHPARNGKTVIRDTPAKVLSNTEDGPVIQYDLEWPSGFNGDLHFQFFYPETTGRVIKKTKQKIVFEWWEHTHFITDEHVVLKRLDMDGPHKDKKYRIFPENWSVEVDFNLMDDKV